ncbi:MAG TPA: succinate dehydrogenase, hydrophobic membrane anchor protein [Gammaproteobacteria bacterium]|jgi:succinate dehydrogenase / fumarate reductase membrane anchor subunit|nr:succinate dehydrogenase, hydrophobic membrane anchor protein [Gammaproteobacteria bacterium]
MVKSVLSVAHEGLRDWMVQRVSAIIMAVYSIGLVFYILTSPELTYSEWHGLFEMTWMKIATLLFVVSLAFHAWIGVWTIFTDYVKNYMVRAVLNVAAILMLTACFLWALMILWSV